MKLIPSDTDFCACIDLDERFEKGWREKLEKVVTTNTGIVQYRYTWNFNPDGSEGIVFFANKIHRYNDFFWKHPVHEVITPKTNKHFDTIVIKDIQLNHYADTTKSREQYLPLLELSVKEDPNDDRNVHYLAREYYFYGEYEKAIKYFKKHLMLPTATWREERASSLRYIAKCYEALNKPNFVVRYLKRAIIENPTTREAFYDLGKYYFVHSKWQNAILAFLAMDNIKERELNYMSSPDCWGYLPYDMLSICFYYMKNKNDAIKYGIEALQKDPTNKRILKNLKIFKEM